MTNKRYPFMRTFLICLFIVICELTFGQNRHFNIGYHDNGICFGNSKNLNGIRFNIVDKNVNYINGINFSLISRYERTNGIKISFHSISKETNGLNIALWGINDSTCNGLTLAVGAGAAKFNGIGIAALGISGSHLNGVFISIIGTSTWSTDLVERVNGVSIGVIIGVQTYELNGLAIGINNYAKEQNGVMIGIFNSSKELHGIQFGLWNVAENNKVFKRVPLVNFNFRKKASR